LKLDLTIGQRLAVGFALMLLILVGLIISVGQAHRASAQAQTAFTRHIAPLTEQAISLERAVYRVAIALRNYTIAPDEVSLMQYRSTAEDAQAALRALNDTPKSGITEALYRDLGVLVRSYLREVDRAVEERREHKLGDGSDRLLNGARERAVAAIRDFSDHQAANTRAALTGMTYARDRVTRDMLAGSAIALVWFLVIAFGTARSVSKPTREVVKVAHGFESGLWKPALAWAPAADTAAGTAPEPRDEMAKLRRAIGAAAAALEKREQRLFADAQVASATAASLDRDEIADRVLLAMVEEVHAEAAALYLRSSDGESLEPIATYALQDELAPIRIGVGIPGEAVRTCRPVVVRDIAPDTPFRIKLGLDELSPKTLVAVPVLFRREPIGVVVVASLHELDDADVTFLRVASGQLAIGLRNAIAHAEVQRLLSAVTEKNQQIAAQNANLQAQNEEIQAQSEEIQAQSEEITAQNEQLREQAEELRTRAAELAQADERKNQFVSVLAHEMRNPMAPITSALYLLSHSAPGSGEVRQAIDIITRQTRQLKALLEDLIDIARIGQGKLRIERKVVDIVTIVRNCTQDRRPLFDQAGLVMNTNFPAMPIRVTGDETRLSQVVSNLLGNALKFSRRSSAITVTVRLDERPGQVMIEVADQGAGLDPAFMPHVFEPFSQAAESGSRAGGMGLGLALVKALTELHGGSVRVQSDGIDKGACFTVRLPTMQQPTSGAVPAQLEGMRQQRRDAGRSLPASRILIVEDQPDAADTLAQVLRLQGHEVAIARSGTEALVRAGDLKPRVILCDIGLPDMDGYEVARRLRSSASGREAILVALTGYAGDQARARAEEAGFDLHLVKPIDVERLGEIVADVELAVERYDG
jgi:signal transduction histidine kinase/ActR/RegA family two-component response regulator